MKSPKVVCLGVHLLDILVKHPQAPVLNPGWQILDDLRITAAGTAAGPAVDLAKLGAQPISMGVIGDDYEGGLMVDLMAGFGCDMSRLVRDPGAPTHISLLFIGPTGERNPIMIRPTGARPLTLDDIDFDVVADADVLHVGGADQMGDFIGEPLVELIRHARKSDVLVTVDVLAEVDEEFRNRLAPALAEANFFFPNEGQLAGMTGTDDPSEGVARLRELTGVETVVGTLGEEGSLILGPDGRSTGARLRDRAGRHDRLRRRLRGGLHRRRRERLGRRGGGLARLGGERPGGHGVGVGLRDRRPRGDLGVHGDPSPGAHRRPRLARST